MIFEYRYLLIESKISFLKLYLLIEFHWFPILKENVRYLYYIILFSIYIVLMLTFIFCILCV